MYSKDCLEKKISVNDGKPYKEDNINKTYLYNEAIELAGNGSYTIGLLMTLSWILLATLGDLFSFPMTVKMASCDFQLNLAQKSFLVSIPFVGSVIMAYPWGYICDTQGRRKSLLISMIVSCLMSTLCAFAPNWIVLATLKLVGTMFVSCGQSVCYTLLGESCADRVKGTYMLIMTSIIHMIGGLIYTLVYFVGGLDFSYDLGFITFVPWRLFVLICALPLAFSALLLLFFYESPKFLLNAGFEENSLHVLRQICRRNGGDDTNYPVKKLVLSEEGNLANKQTTLLKSLWEQTAPLFQPPLLQNTLLLYFLIFVIYSSNSSLVIWLPFLTEAFSAPIDRNQGEGLCNMISLTLNSTSHESCSSPVDLPVVVGLCGYGLSASILNLLLSKLANRKRILMLGTFLVASIFCLGTSIPSNVTIYFYFGIMYNSLCMGYASSYYVDLYPTSFRGMAACLGVMMSRLSSIAGINLVGPFITTECSVTFYSLTVLLFSGAVMSYFLPPDAPKKN